MQKQSFFHSLSPNERYMVGNLFFLYLIQGVFVILIGSILPMMKEEYHLSYQIGGFLISAHSVGNLITGLIAGLLPLAIGLKTSKTSLILLNTLPFIGFAITLATGNPWLLIFALLLTGIGRGAVSNYNNQGISALSGGSAMPLNMLHGFFAIGAVTAPVLTLLFTDGDPGGWRITVYVVIALGIVSMITSVFVKMDSIPYGRPEKGKNSFVFVKDRQFLLSVAIMFFYLCVEASVMGWMVTYYTDSGVVTAESAQMLNSLLWVVILVGRFTCSAMATRMDPRKIIMILCTGMVLGSVVTSSIIGGIAAYRGIHAGMGVLLIPAAVTFLLALVNIRKSRR